MSRFGRLSRKVFRWVARRVSNRFVATLATALDRRKAASEEEEQFFLDSETTKKQYWSEVLVGGDRRLAFRITCFDSIHSHPVVAGEDTLLSLELCVASGNPVENVSILVDFCPEGEEARELLRVGLALLVGKKNSVVYTVSLGNIAGIRGTFGVSLARQGDATDYVEVSILEFAVANAGLLPLLRARSHKSWRLHNELEHFGSGVYDHAMYDKRNASSPRDDRNENMSSDDPGMLHHGELTRISLFPRDAIEKLLRGEEWGIPQSEDDPYHYAHRLLGKLLPIQPPDFTARLKSRGGTLPVRLLSICSGTAAVELGIISASGVTVEATFVDINHKLIKQAIGRLPENCSGQCFIGNVNDIWPLPLKYDIVVCVSGLHHIVELEQTLSGIRDCLEPDGEFWIVGEQIGRNGNRLWPEAFVACSHVMSKLPPRYRINSYSGAVDEKLPNHNFGSASFEGIRSEEIGGLVERYFLPMTEYRRNAFLWRLVNQTYANNYDLQKEDDVHALQQLVVAEAECWWQGGRPTELFGVYAPRRLTIGGMDQASLSP